MHVLSNLKEMLKNKLRWKILKSTLNLKLKIQILIYKHKYKHKRKYEAYILHTPSYATSGTL